MEKKYPDKFFYAGWMGPERYALLAGCDFTLLPSRCCFGLSGKSGLKILGVMISTFISRCFFLKTLKWLLRIETSESEFFQLYKKDHRMFLSTCLSIFLDGFYTLLLSPIWEDSI